MTDRWRAARALLDQAKAMGLELADLVAAGGAAAAPTVAVYVEVVATTFTPGTARTYLPYLRLAAELHAGRRLDDLTVTDLQRSRHPRPATPARQHRPLVSRDHRRRPLRAIDMPISASTSEPVCQLDDVASPLVPAWPVRLHRGLETSRRWSTSRTCTVRSFSSIRYTTR
jgi:hypothetical protein